jgi:hypothetical protein
MKRLIVCTFLALSPLGCSPGYTTLTAAQVVERGTRRYPNVTREQATEGCARALATLGYEVTVKDPGTGTVKTAPRSILASSQGTSGYAELNDDSLSWSITVQASGAEAVLSAAPRGFRNGTEVKEAAMWTAQVLDGKFRDLWSEVDAALGAKLSPWAPPPPPK